jgi:hypothetical protein
MPQPEQVVSDVKKVVCEFRGRQFSCMLVSPVNNPLEADLTRLDRIAGDLESVSLHDNRVTVEAPKSTEAQVKEVEIGPTPQEPFTIIEKTLFFRK